MVTYTGCICLSTLPTAITVTSFLLSQIWLHHQLTTLSHLFTRRNKLYHFLRTASCVSNFFRFVNVWFSFTVSEVQFLFDNYSHGCVAQSHLCTLYMLRSSTIMYPISIFFSRTLAYHSRYLWKFDAQAASSDTFWKIVVSFFGFRLKA